MMIMAKKLDELTYVDEAEKVINKLKTNKKGDIYLKTNKIRNMLTLFNEMYMPIKNSNKSKLDSESISKLRYTKMRLVYEAGRDEYVRDLLEKSELLDYIDNIKVGSDTKELIQLCHYMEALVAFHRFYTNEKIN